MAVQLPELVITAPGPRKAVRTFKPQISVVLLKNIGRASAGGNLAASERFVGGKRIIDLTPYLGDASSVVVSKSVNQAAGMFSIVLADRMSADDQDSLYGLIEPLDIVEIRMARDVSLNDYAGLPNHMPIMMRGFVSEVRRRQTMTERGPRRFVTISGQDYGKILQMMRITYLPGMVLGQHLLSSYKLAMNYGVGEKPYDDAAKFILDVVQNIIKPFQAQMISASLAGAAPSATSPIMELGADVSLGGNGAISPFGVNEWGGGSVDELLRYFGDVGPWNELYVEDRETGPFLVYRPTPFRTLDGDYIQPMNKGQEPATVTVRDSDLVELDVGRSEQGVANYFWVDAPRYTLIDGAVMQAGAQAVQGGGWGPNPFLMAYPNSSPDLYGMRLMQTQTQQGMRIDGQSEDIQNEQLPLALKMVAAKRQVLIDNNRDNVVYESGSMQLKGNEAIRPGMYVNLKRGAGRESSILAEHYAHSVVHEFMPFRSYTTSIQFDRGTGFVERIQRGAGAASPYLAEMSLKGTGE